LEGIKPSIVQKRVSRDHQHQQRLELVARYWDRPPGTT